MPSLSPETRADIELMLAETDRDAVAIGVPILSSIVIDDETKKVTDVFWQSVKLYGLRLPGETDEACLARLREETFAFYRDERH